MIRYFEIDWADLEYSKQQEILEEVKADILANLQEEAEQERPKLGTDFADVDWELVANELHLWSSKDDEQTDDEFLSDIRFEMENYIEKLAEDACWRGFKYLQGEVEI